MTGETNLARQLADLLRAPRETLEVEIKGWLDLADGRAHQAILAKAIIALANHGGGYVVLGFTETPSGMEPADPRPENLNAYTSDAVNGIVSRFVEPSFHCEVDMVTRPDDGEVYPVISVPGGHYFPIRSRRAGPDGQIIQANVYYTRRPGPSSEPPQSGGEWDKLIRQCVTNNRQALADQFRTILAGGNLEESPQAAKDLTKEWKDSCFQRWEALASELSEGHPARLTHGRYYFAYQISHPDLSPKALPEFRDSMRQGVVRLTGWPPFWYPTREDIAPYIHEGMIECFIGPGMRGADPAQSDFWRGSPEGRFFLLRGLQEDSGGDVYGAPGRCFDLVLPVWRLGEVLLHAESMARELGVPDAKISLLAGWDGLEGRVLVSRANPARNLFDDRQIRQDTYSASISVQADRISDTLPELVTEIVKPLFELFDFFVLPANLVNEELGRMRDFRN